MFKIELVVDYNMYRESESYLSIPKISFKKSIYKIGDIENNVDKNIELIKDDYNNIIIAGHSGIGEIAYFNDLDKLSIGDLIYFNYDGILRIYELNLIYEIIKNGYFKIENYSVPVINLITCKKDSDKIQIVYVGYLLK